MLIILVVVIFAAFFSIKYFKSDIKESNIFAAQNNTNGLSVNSTTTWNNYYDENYRFSLDYPSNLDINLINNEKINLADSLGGENFIINGGVSFYQKDGYWIIVINIFDNSDISSFEKWIEKENKKNENLHQQVVIEKRIKIDGYDAIVTHIVSDFEGPDKHEKKIVFIKNGILFEINTRYIDHEKVWNSFKFVK